MESIELRPRQGATAAARLPATALSWDGESLIATDHAVDLSVRLPLAVIEPGRPACSTLLLYSYAQPRLGAEDGEPIFGLALLTPDRLVLADLPGRWDGEEVRRFAAPLGLSVFEAGATHSTQARTALAARAPGWIRLAGMPAPPPARWRRPVAVGAGVLGLAAMVYLISIGAGYAWRAFSSVGRVLIDVIEAKWLVVMFSPVLVVLSPVRKRLLRRRLGSGSVIGSVGGLHLDVSSGALRVRRGWARCANTGSGRSLARRPGCCSTGMPTWRDCSCSVLRALRWSIYLGLGLRSMSTGSRLSMGSGCRFVRWIRTSTPPWWGRFGRRVLDGRASCPVMVARLALKADLCPGVAGGGRVGLPYSLGVNRAECRVRRVARLDSAGSVNDREHRG